MQELSWQQTGWHLRDASVSVCVALALPVFPLHATMLLLGNGKASDGATLAEPVPPAATHYNMSL